MTRVCSLHGRDEVGVGFYNWKWINYLERICVMESVYCTYFIIAF